MASYSWNVGSPYSGTWNTTTNWSPVGAPLTSADTATLSKPLTSSPTLTVNGAISPLSITFGNTGATGTNHVWILGSAGTPSPSWNLTTDSAVTVTNRNGQRFDASCFMPITGSFSLTKSGAGAWVINNNTSTITRIIVKEGPYGWSSSTPSNRETWIGDPTTSESGITLGISGGSLLSGTLTITSANVTFYRDALLGWSSEYAGGLRITGTVTIAAGTGAATTRTLTVGSFATTLGALSGSTNLTITKTGTGTLTFDTASSSSVPYTGTLTQDAASNVITVSNANVLQDGIYNTNSAAPITFPASSVIGGLTGSANVAFATAGVTFGGVNVDVSSTWSGNFTSNVTLTKSAPAGGTSVLTLSGNGSTRAGAATTISRGAIQLNANLALYASSATGTTTVSSGAGLWLSGGITTPANAPITISGTGTALNGAIRNVSGSNTVGSTITKSGNATIQNDVSGTTLTLKALALGSADTLTLAAGSGATIRMEGATSGSSTGKLLIPSTNAGTVQAGTVSLFSSLGSTATVQIDGIFDLNGNSQTVSGTLDGIGSMVGSGTVSMSTGSTLKAGSGAGGGTLSMGALSFGASSQSMSLIKNAGDLSKVAVTNAVTNAAGGTTTVNATSTTGWTNGATYTFLTYGSRSGTGTFAAGTLTGGTGRQAMQTPVVGATSATFSVAEGAASVTWNGGIGGQWYDNQATGWTGSGPSGSVTDFRNGDTVTFNATSTAAATLTGNVNVVSLTMNGAAHTVGASGAYTLTNAGALTVSGAFKQTLNAAGEHGAVSVGAGSTLELGHPNALGSGTTAITLSGSSARLAFNATANGFSTNRPLTLSPAAAGISQYLETSGNVVVSISGAFTGGQSTSWCSKVGSGLISFAVSSVSTSAAFRIGVSGTSETAGANAVRFGSTYPSQAIRLNSASILELSNAFTKTYGTSAGQIYVEDTSGAGAGFSAYNASGITVSTAINFGTTASTQWNGPMYFGTALGTATGKLTMSGTLATTSTTASPQRFHVFNGATSGAASTAQINTLNSSPGGAFTFEKTGPGALYVVNGNSGAALSFMRVSEGAYEVGPTTFNATGNIEIPSGATNAVVRQEASVGSTTCPAFSPAPAANFTVEAAGTGTFTLSTLDIDTRTVTLSGTGTGVKNTTSGNGTGKYIKTGTGTWSLNFPYASKAAGFSGGIDATQGTIRTTEKFGLGGGPIAITAGASVQFASTDAANMGSIASLTTTGSTARIIIGA